jgi:hypothetical protein
VFKSAGDRSLGARVPGSLKCSLLRFREIWMFHNEPPLLWCDVSQSCSTQPLVTDSRVTKGVRTVALVFYRSDAQVGSGASSTVEKARALGPRRFGGAMKVFLVEIHSCEARADTDLLSVRLQSLNRPAVAKSDISLTCSPTRR